MQTRNQAAKQVLLTVVVVTVVAGFLLATHSDQPDQLDGIVPLPYDGAEDWWGTLDADNNKNTTSNDCPTKRKRKFFKCCQPRTALASFPGAGNTWVRYLLEQTTGITSHSNHNRFYKFDDTVLCSKILSGQPI